MNHSSKDALASPALVTRAEIFTRDYAVRGDYQRADTQQTLREGLAEYYTVNPGLSDPSTLNHQPSATFFHRHDCTHVVFGTHTGPLDEGVNDLFTIHGVDISFVQYLRAFFATSEVEKVASQYTARTALTLLIGTIKLYPRVLRTCRAMTRPWPWSPPSGALDRPIVDIRDEYGIHVWRPEVALGLGER